MTSQVEGQSVYVPAYAKEAGHETATTTSLTSVEAAKAELANANVNEKDIAMETDEKDAAALDVDENSEELADDDEADYLPMGPKLYLIVFSLMMAVFCVALDNTVRPPHASPHIFSPPTNPPFRSSP
jgi:hypothetical protein